MSAGLMAAIFQLTNLTCQQDPQKTATGADRFLDSSYKITVDIAFFPCPLPSRTIFTNNV